MSTQGSVMTTRRPWNALTTIGLLLIAGVAGAILTYAALSIGHTREADEPTPAPTVTAQPTGLQACKAALQDADHTNTTVAEIGHIIADHMRQDSDLLQQLAVNDWTGLDDYTAHIEDMGGDVAAITDTIQASSYGVNRAMCLQAIGEQA